MSLESRAMAYNIQKNEAKNERKWKAIGWRVDPHFQETNIHLSKIDMSLFNHDKQKNESKTLENALLKVQINRGVPLP